MMGGLRSLKTLNIISIIIISTLLLLLFIGFRVQGLLKLLRVQVRGSVGEFRGVSRSFVFWISRNNFELRGLRV